MCSAVVHVSLTWFVDCGYSFICSRSRRHEWACAAAIKLLQRVNVGAKGVEEGQDRGKKEMLGRERER